MVTINIDNLSVLIKSNISILEACKYIGINIPKFCYHESLSIAGNCRMCLVELQKTPKPIASCAMPVINNMTVFSSTPLVKKARENVLETLLINHPLDCPICDQGGECDLQDETKTFGIDITRHFFAKRSVEDKNCGLIIKTIMTRCIHCTRCVRFSSEIAGNDFFGTINRGTNTEISNYVPKSFNSFLSGNVIDLCPVGALTSKNYAFKARPWELKSIETLDLTDGSGTMVYFNYKESEIVRVLPKINKNINDNWISDRIRFSFDSFTNSRLHSVFEQENNKYNKTNWNFVIKKLKYKIVDQLKTVLFLVNNEIDLHSLILLKKITNYSNKKLLVQTIEKKKKENLYINLLSNKINDIKYSKVCFLFFINTLVENIVINTKLKVKYNKQKFEIFNFGNQFNSTFPVNFSNVSIKNLIKFFESKLLKISKSLVELSSFPLIIIGENFTNKITSQVDTILFLKKIIPSAVIITVKIKANSESVHLTNISNNNSNFCNKSDFVISINLDDTLYLRRYIDFKKQNIWLNSYGSNIAAKNKYILPTLHYFEENNVFLNLEQRPQESSTLFTKINDAKSTKFLLKYILRYISSKVSLNTLSYTYKHTFFIKEMLTDLYLFKKIKVKMTLLFNKIFHSYNIKFILFYKYNMKSIIEDFFLVNSFCKNSLILNNFSLDYRKTSKNFYF